MIYRCPGCAKRTKVLHSPRQYEAGGLLRRRRCTDHDCKHEGFETLESERGVVEAIALRRFKKQFGVELAALRAVVAELQVITNALRRH